MKAFNKPLLAAILIVLIITVLGLAISPAPAQASNPGQYGTQYSAPPFACTYVVRPGDDLFRIGLRFGVSAFVLANLNGLPNPNLVFAGMVLRVPCSFPPPPQPPPYPNVCSIHFVQRGEWLGLIAARFGVPWQSIAAVNHLANPNLIFAGMRLLIPCPAGPNPYSAGSNPYAPMNPYAPGMNPYAQPMPPAMTTPAPGPGAILVNMQNVMFNPSTITIRVGQTVIWRDLDSVQHSATQGACSGSSCTPAAGGFDTGILSPGQTSSGITFNTAGTFHYYCRIHGAMMQGNVVVMP